MENKYTLPKEFGEKWIAALRSGEYEQITGCLMEENKDGEYCYCANGVGYIGNGYDVCGWSTVLIDGIKKSGYESNMPIPYRLFKAIVELNDDYRLTFPEIADWIEANVSLT